MDFSRFFSLKKDDRIVKGRKSFYLGGKVKDQKNIKSLIEQVVCLLNSVINSPKLGSNEYLLPTRSTY